jgi:hypothetical protein
MAACLGLQESIVAAGFLRFPRIEDLDAKAGEILHIPRDDDESRFQGRGRRFPWSPVECGRKTGSTNPFQATIRAPFFASLAPAG